jgi:hypothetical protein
MVARLMSVSDDTELTDLHDVFQQVLGGVVSLGIPFRSMGRSSTASGVVHDLSHCESFACIARRSSSTSTTSWGCGNGNSVKWTFSKVWQKTQNRFAWVDAALRPRKVAVGPEVTG